MSTAEIETCPRCGAPLPAGEHGELCPACLLSGALGERSTVGAAPKDAPPRSGHVRCPGELGDYRLLSQLGQGGIGRPQARWRVRSVS